MTALENVMVGVHPRSRAGFVAGMLHLPSTWREEKDVERRARALAAQPELLLLDEPAAGLNMRETAELARLIGRIRERGVTVLIVEHDMGLVMKVSDEVAVLSYGQKIADATPRAVQRDPEVIRVYLGDDAC